MDMEVLQYLKEGEDTANEVSGNDKNKATSEDLNEMRRLLLVLVVSTLGVSEISSGVNFVVDFIQSCAR